MNVTEELNQLIAEHGNERDALNVTLAKLRQAQSEIAVLKEAAQQSVQSDGDDIEALGRQARMIADQQAGNRSGLRPRR